jgi:hypothetical protein
MPLPVIAEKPRFRAVLIAESAASPEWKASVSSWLVKSGCLYFLAWGRDCEVWHDSVDHANIEQCGPGEIPDGEFVMTTWHNEDPLEEVFWFAKNNADHPTVDLARSLLVHISPEPNETELLRAYADA